MNSILLNILVVLIILVLLLVSIYLIALLSKPRVRSTGVTVGDTIDVTKNTTL